ncbi:MAG: hypothetical protein IKM11_07195 [Oscillospiraceae bacterium]|nr:hypothetical protein [Oscillospiraceae bacterium]
MSKVSRRLAICSVTAALGVVLMLLGAVLGLGTYMAPMFVGWCLIPIGKEYGVKYQTMLWIVISLLSALFVANIEQNLMFIFLFGWYPIVRPKIQRLSRIFRFIVKLLLFNAVVISVEAAIITFFIPEAMEVWMAIVLIVLGNATFFFYDFAFPVFELLADLYLKKLFGRNNGR